MSKLYFKYGALNSSKSANLLMAAHNYESTGREIILFRPSVDTRSDEGMIESRVGLKHKANTFAPDTNLYEVVKELSNDGKLDGVLIDEVQMCSQKQIDQLVQIVDGLGIDVMCYGLKSTYTAELFPAISKLIVLADKTDEIKTVCTYCRKKAIMNLLVANGKPVYEGETLRIGDVATTDEDKKQIEEYYVAVCREHYFNPPESKL